MATGASSTRSSLPDELLSLHATMSFVFELGVLAPFASLGARGWLRSRRLGLSTSTAAFVAATVVVFQFVA